MIRSSDSLVQSCSYLQSINLFNESKEE
jgi:hypothetical protein